MKYHGRFKALTTLGVSLAVMALAYLETPGQETATGAETIASSESDLNNSEEIAGDVGEQVPEETEDGVQSAWDGGASEPRTFGDYTYVLQADESVKITGYEGLDSELIIPAEFDGHSVTSVSENAFLNARDVSAVTLPDSLISIEGNPFRFCLNLEQISVSSSHPVFAVIDNVLFEMADKSGMMRCFC